MAVGGCRSSSELLVREEGQLDGIASLRSPLRTSDVLLDGCQRGSDVDGRVFRTPGRSTEEELARQYRMQLAGRHEQASTEANHRQTFGAVRVDETPRTRVREASADPQQPRRLGHRHGDGRVVEVSTRDAHRSAHVGEGGPPAPALPPANCRPTAAQTRRCRTAQYRSVCSRIGRHGAIRPRRS